ncbi:hypothetical protein NIES2100_36580 [Calothrix sp. NIES-2100]|uniref:Pb-reticulocyte-binding protein n=1 Tax=Calothrix sp. NIES-2100 TaxID=1954172 RepID=UPI000B605F59|nr:hypothetical protein NIES2100_36580 [Calothrix sp. NIES-2100]
MIYTSCFFFFGLRLKVTEGIQKQLTMIQAIDFEQTFVTHLEKFMGKADKFIKFYYTGISEETHLKEIMLAVKNLALDADLQQLEAEYQMCSERKDFMADCDDSAWW